MEPTNVVRRSLARVLHRMEPQLVWWARHGRPHVSKKLLLGVFQPAFDDRPKHEFRCTTIFGSEMTGNTEDLIPALIWWTGALEWNLTYWLEERLREGDVFVDVGAHMGYFSLLGSRCVGETGRVVAVEASPKTHALLLANLALNPHARNVRPVAAAAGDRRKTLPFYRAPDSATGISSIRQRPGSGAVLEAEVEMAPLAELLERDEMRRARAVKIDVEGAEFEAVDGLLKGVGDLRDDVEIIVETSRDWERDGKPATVDDLVDVFRPHGFHAYVMPKEILPRPRRYKRPERARGKLEWGYYDLVFSRTDARRL